MARKVNQTKKTVFFIVEGNTDKTALETIFKKLYKHKNIRYEFTNGDITSNQDISKENVLDKIYDTIKPYMLQDKLKKSDIWQIVQIFDMDGAYVPDKAIITGTTKEFYYSTTTISCLDKTRIKDRNNHKMEMMDFLLTQKEVKGIPYRCYYMSSNLDHALYDKQNLNDEDKAAYAVKFNQLFDGKEKMFIEFLKTDAVNGVPSNYPASWKYIKEELHSLERHTNLHIYFDENPLM